jgi:uncharacterized protein with NAD-binding domain and iron-sulfur cluster
MALKRVAILGGGMAGLAAAWRLSEPGWQDRYESITVYQRGWRLGGKGASSRGQDGRIEEHGLHIWLGYYENAFALLRECYEELDRATTDPRCPIKTWDEALIPANDVALAEKWGDDWVTWVGQFSGNNRLPGQPGGNGRELTTVEFVQRAVQLVLDYLNSVTRSEERTLRVSATPDPPDPPNRALLQAVRSAAVAALLAVADGGRDRIGPKRILDEALELVRAELDCDDRLSHRRMWMLICLILAAVRGTIVDGVVTDARGFRALNDQSFDSWILGHGAHKEVLDFPLIRGTYDLVFGYEEADPERPAFPAGLMMFLCGLGVFTYRGAIFWKMTAGMGDVVIAPIYEVLRRRGVRFEFFHRLDGLHLDPGRRRISAVSLGRQAVLADGVDEYQPLVRARGLPVFPSAPVAGQIARGAAAEHMETFFGARDDVETRVLRDGVDFDELVLAVSLGMVPIVAPELLADRREWRDMTTHVKTVATQAFQLWLRPDEQTLGWDRPGATLSAYERPFETWSSMAQTLWAEDWPAGDHPGAVAYFCGSLDAPWPPAEPLDQYVRSCRQRVYANAATWLDRHVGLFLPNSTGAAGFDWSLLVGVDGQRGSEALATQHVSVNIDPSDRYVQSVPGSDRYRLRPDESGYDNLALAGDWTDCGMNAGCIEAAVTSGLQAANYLLGRGRRHRIRGYYLP